MVVVAAVRATVADARQGPCTSGLAVLWVAVVVHFEVAQRLDAEPIPLAMVTVWADIGLNDRGAYVRIGVAAVGGRPSWLLHQCSQADRSCTGTYTVVLCWQMTNIMLRPSSRRSLSSPWGISCDWGIINALPGPGYQRLLAKGFVEYPFIFARLPN